MTINKFQFNYIHKHNSHLHTVAMYVKTYTFFFIKHLEFLVTLLTMVYHIVCSFYFVKKLTESILYVNCVPSKTHNAMFVHHQINLDLPITQI